MKCFNRLIFSSLLLLSGSAMAEVVVAHQGERYQFEARPRLVDVIQRLPDSARHSYWPQAALYLTDPAAEDLRQTLLQQLDALHSTLSATQRSDLALSVSVLIKQVASWRIGRRIPLQIDYDRARTQLQSNPLFEPGNYVMTTTARKAVITFSGLVKQNSVAHQPGQFAAVYCTDDNALIGADTRQCMLQRPDGTLHRVEVGSQLERVEAAPGSQFIVLFEQTLLPVGFEQLNTLLLDVARNRIYL